MTGASAAGDEAEQGLRLVVRDDVASLIFDRPDSKVNLLTSATMRSLDATLGELEAAHAANAVHALVVRSAKQDNFIAGADINELAELSDAESATRISSLGQDIFGRLERLPFPTLAAIDGSCLGGGLELALACDYRVASNNSKTRLGLPETRLGILPGLGGTVRLPRLIGLRRALELILAGKQIRVQPALKMGLVDAVLPADRFDSEVDSLAADLARGAKPLSRRKRSFWARLLEESAPSRWLVRRISLKSVYARTKGHYPALPKAVKVTVRGVGQSPARAYAEEASAFGQLAVTPESRNLINVFLLTEGARKRRPSAEPRAIERAAVIGAGVMGAGIAELFAYQALPVLVVDIDEERVRAGIHRARELLDKAGERAGWSPETLEERKQCLKGATKYDSFSSIDAVVEAAIERMDVKREVFAALEAEMPSTSLIASNTSALSISKLQSDLEHPDRVCGIHFFNPPHVMPLVEIVRGKQTSDATLATAFELALHLGKTPIIVHDSPGFVVNRILAAYLTEAGHLLQEGMEVRSIDEVMKAFGMPMGPLRLLDEIGLDVIAMVSQTLEVDLGERFKPAPVMAKILATGVTGKKGGRGFYVYEDGRRSGLNEEISAVLRQAASGSAPPRPPLAPAKDVAQTRMIFGMINEAARTLDDQVVAGPEDIDVAMIMGAGFPPFLGGLLRYADSLGLDKITRRLRQLAERYGPRFEPAPGLLQRSAFFSPQK